MTALHYVMICRQLIEQSNVSVSELAEGAELNLNTVKALIKECSAAGLINQYEAELIITEKGQEHYEKFRVKNAIILAAGFGSRCVPLTYETPKGLLVVRGKPMIERQIEQLIEKDINEIIVVVGYKKEKFDYLIDKYGVKLIYNPDYATKNNLSSLYHAVQWMDSSYILCSDHWINDSVFNTHEAHSWYSCVYFDGITDEWCVTESVSDRIKSISVSGENAWAIVGPAYFSSSFSKLFKQYLIEYYNRPDSADYYWEHILMEQIDSLRIYMNKQTENVFEIENLEELRKFDVSYNEASNNEILKIISNVLDVPQVEIKDIVPVKVGMTNRSFTFINNGIKYIMRIPGEGTEKLINRKQEHTVYQAIAAYNICDDLVYIDPQNGYKISKFIEDARVCDKLHFPDVKACMRKLKEVHALKINVEHAFDPFERIEYYESLWLDNVSCYSDYEDTKANVMKLKSFLDTVEKEWTLSHIDAVPDNFLIVNNGGKERVLLIDWEYSGMQDPHIDIAMFAVYAMYDERHINELISCYFDEGCTDIVRMKIYAYIAVCGLLWSNWCEYKRYMGVEFGEYAVHQYRFAKDYYRIFCDRYEAMAG